MRVLHYMPLDIGLLVWLFSKFPCSFTLYTIIEHKPARDKPGEPKGLEMSLREPDGLEMSLTGSR